MASHTRRLKKGGSHSKSHKGRKGHKGHKGGKVHRKSRHTRGKKRGGARHSCTLADQAANICYRRG